MYKCRQLTQNPHLSPCLLDYSVIEIIHCPYELHHLVFYAFEVTALRTVLFILIFICIIALNPISGLYFLFMRFADTLSALDGDMWIHLFCFFYPLLEVDLCHCPCGSLSCFKLPVLALLQQRSSFPFLLVLLSFDAYLVFDDFSPPGSGIFISFHFYLPLFLLWILDSTEKRFLCFVDLFFCCSSDNYFPPYKKGVFSLLVWYVGLIRKSFLNANHCCFCFMKEGKGQKP